MENAQILHNAAVCVCVCVCACMHVYVWTEWTWSVHYTGISTYQLILYYDDDRFLYIALFSTLEQTHCTCVCFYTSE